MTISLSAWTLGETEPGYVQQRGRLAQLPRLARPRTQSGPLKETLVVSAALSVMAAIPGASLATPLLTYVSFLFPAGPPQLRPLKAGACLFQLATL